MPHLRKEFDPLAFAAFAQNRGRDFLRPRQAVIAMDHEARRGPAQIDADDDAARRRLGNVPLRSGGGGRVHRSGVHSSRGGHGRAGKALS